MANLSPNSLKNCSYFSSYESVFWNKVAGLLRESSVFDIRTKIRTVLELLILLPVGGHVFTEIKQSSLMRMELTVLQTTLNDAVDYTVDKS